MTKQRLKLSSEVFRPGDDLSNPKDLLDGQDYLEYIFMTWYQAGRPNARKLQLTIKENKYGTKLSVPDLKRLIETEFADRAAEMDAEVADQLKSKLVQDKLSMLQQHAGLGVELATMGIEYLRENGIGNARNALQAITLGVQIERNSRGVDAVLSQIANKTDQELLDDLRSLVEKSPVKLSPSLPPDDTVSNE